MNKFEIIEAMKVKPTINPEEEVRLRVEFIKNNFYKVDYLVSFWVLVAV